MANDDVPATPLHAHRGESGHQHRALLLFTMQDPSRRSMRAVARAIGRQDNAIRKWRKRFNWDERIEKVGELCQPLAVKLYDQIFRTRFGRRETSEVEPRMSIPSQPMDPMPGPDGKGEGEKWARQRALDEPAVRAMQSRYARLLDGAVAKFARDLTGGKIRVRNTGEAIAAMRLAMELQKELDGVEERAVQGVAIVETVRVRQAKATGGNVLLAMHDDIRELSAITDALVAREGPVAEQGQEASE